MTHHYRPDGTIKYTDYTPEELEERQKIRYRNQRIEEATDRLSTFMDDLDLCPDYRDYILDALRAKEKSA